MKDVRYFSVSERRTHVLIEFSCSLKDRKHFSVRHLSAINQLLKQLAPDAPTLTTSGLLEVLKNSHLLIARTNRTRGQIIGMGCLVEINKLSGKCGLIEDVVVHERHRGDGLGERMVKGLIAQAKALGCRYVELTSRAERKEANALYLRIGFQKRETNVFRLLLV